MRWLVVGILLVVAAGGVLVFTPLANHPSALAARHALQIQLQDYAKVATIRLDGVGEFRMFLNPDDPVMTPRIMLRGIWEGNETHWFTKSVGPGDTVVDIRANVGWYTLIGALLVGAQGRVYAFEPDPVNFEILERNVRLNGFENVVLEQMAISNALDDYFADLEGRIDYVKIDTQGAEGVILEGMQQTIERYDLLMAVEFWPFRLTEFGSDAGKLLDDLASHDFRFFDLRPGAASPPRPIRKAELLQHYTLQNQSHTHLYLLKGRDELERLESGVRRSEAALFRESGEIRASREAWAAGLEAGGEAAWTVVRPAFEATHGSEVETLEDGSLLVTRPSGEREAYTLTFEPGLSVVTGVRLETLPDARLTKGRQSHGVDGSFQLAGVELRQTRPDARRQERIRFGRALASFEAPGHPIQHALDGNARTGWSAQGQLDRRIEAVFTLETPLKVAPGADLVLEMQPLRDNVGRFRVAITAAPEPLPEELTLALLLPAEDRSAHQEDALRRYFQQHAPELAGARDALARTREALVQFQQFDPSRRRRR